LHLFEHLEENAQQHAAQGYAATLSVFQCQDKNFFLIIAWAGAWIMGAIGTNFSNCRHVYENT